MHTDSLTHWLIEHQTQQVVLCFQVLNIKVRYSVYLIQCQKHKHMERELLALMIIILM